MLYASNLRCYRKVFLCTSCLFILFVTLMLDVRMDVYVGPQWTFLLFYLVFNVFVSEQIGGWFAYLFAVLSASCRAYTGTLVWDSLVVELWSSLNCIIGFVFISYLIQRKNFTLEALRKSSLTDPLTQISNRRAFNESLTKALAHAQRFQEKVSIAYIDVDGFKMINDCQGHDRGDQLLCLISSTIKQVLRADDVVARLGGDEFAIIFSGEELIIHRLKTILDNVCQKQNFNVSFSIGIVHYSGTKAINGNALMKFADEAMYSVKKTSKNSIKVARI